MNDITSNANAWYWISGGGSSRFNGMKVGNEQIYSISGSYSFVSSFSCTMSSGIPTIILAIKPTSSISTAAFDRWLVMKFDYTAIQSDFGD